MSKLRWHDADGELLAYDGQVMYNWNEKLTNDSPTLAVSLTSSDWSALWLISPDSPDHYRVGHELSKVTIVRFPFPPGGPYTDPSGHTPNPEYVQKLAAENNWAIADLSWELMLGRWSICCDG
jgi:hypothetical protein